MDDYGGRDGCPEIGMVRKVRLCVQGFREPTISRLDDGEIRAFAGVVKMSGVIGRISRWNGSE